MVIIEVCYEINCIKLIYKINLILQYFFVRVMHLLKKEWKEEAIVCPMKYDVGPILHCFKPHVSVYL